MKSDNQFKTLSEVIKAKNFKQSVIIALVLDFTNNYLTSQGKLIRLKIIDDSFLFDKKQSSIVYFQVLNITGKKNIMKIGDIAYIKEFSKLKMDKFQGKKEEVYEIETKAHIHVFEQSKTNNYWCGSCQKKILLCDQSQKRIEDLRDYSFKLFSQTQLKDLYWKGFTNSDQIVKMNFDLLLKIDQIELINQQQLPKYYKFHFSDSDLNIYYLKEQTNDFEIGEIVKIRDKENQIVQSCYSTVQRLQKFFFDVVNFDKFKYEIVRYAKDNYEFEDYNHDLQDENRKFSFIKKIHQNNYNITSLEFLLNKQRCNDYYSIKHMKYRIQCYVIDIKPYNLQDVIRRISYFDKNLKQKNNNDENVLIYPLKDDNFSIMDQLNRILEVQVLVKDTSIDLNKDVVNLSLIQEEVQNDHDFFKGVELLKINQQNLKEYQRVFDHIVNRLFKETNSMKQVDIIVQPILFQSKILFKIIDTQFLP